MKLTNIATDQFLRFLRRRLVFFGFLTYSIFSWWWILEIDLARLASTSFAGKIMQIIVLVVVSFLSAGIYATSLKFLFKTLSKKQGWFVPIKLVMWWAATELFVAWAVCIIWYGVGGRFDNVLPFTSLSHFAVWTPLGYLSRFVGLYGFSGVVFMLAMIFIKPELRKFIFPVVAVTSIATFFAWGLYRNPSGPIENVVLVSESSKQNKLLDVLRPKDRSLVVLPEYGLNSIDDEYYGKKISVKSPEEVVYFVSSRFTYEQDKIKNQLVAGDTKTGYIYKIDKSRLIPAGEYLPYVMQAFFNAVGANDLVKDFQARRQIYKADSSQQQALLTFGDMKVGAGICSSIIAPEDYRLLAKNGADIFTNSAYLGVFNGSSSYHWHHQAMAKFMSIANARTFVQSSTSGPAFVYDSSGKRVYYSEETAATELLVSLNSRRTVYSFLGEFLAIGGLVWIFVELVRLSGNNYKRIMAKDSRSI